MDQAVVDYLKLCRIGRYLESKKAHMTTGGHDTLIEAQDAIAAGATDLLLDQLARVSPNELISRLTDSLTKFT